MSAPVYLDCAATAPADPRVVELMVRCLTADFGNSGSFTHRYGTAARSLVEHARDQIAAALGFRRSEIFFTSGATEANNLAIQGAGPGSHVITTAIEHPAVLEPIRMLEKRGVEVTRIRPTAGGWVRAEDVLEAVRADTGLVSMMHINNETGVIQPIEAVAEGLAAAGGALFHVDASQSFGKLMEPLRHARIDLVSLSGHKMGGAQGIGALAARKRVRPALKPLLFGGGQEGGLRPGTLPVHLIAGFGLAAELAAGEASERLRRAQQFRDGVIAGLEPAGFRINGDRDRMSPWILNGCFPGLDNQQVTEAWADLAAVSNGSACTSQSMHCSHVLHAMGLSDAQAAGAIRLSWNDRTEPPDFEAMVRALEGLPREEHGRVS